MSAHNNIGTGSAYPKHNSGTIANDHFRTEEGLRVSDCDMDEVETNHKIRALEIEPSAHHTLESVIDTEADLVSLSQTHEGEHRHDHGDGLRVPISRAICLFTFCAALNSCNLGYDIGVNTDAAKLLQDDMNLSDVQIEIFMGSLNLFATVGALLAHIISDRCGRRGGFISASAGFIVGIVIMSASQSYVALMCGRALVGLGVGFGIAIDPVYISEISPAAHRGRLVTCSDIGINVGILLGFSSGLIFYQVPSSKAWRFMFLMGAVLPAVLIFLVVYVMPESPRWLVMKGRDDDAKDVLKRIYPPGYNVDIVVTEIKGAIAIETAAENAIGWNVILFPTPAFRRMLILGIGTAVAQQAVGIDAIQYFLVYIIEDSGIKKRASQTAVLMLLGVLKLSVIIWAGSLFDTRGRRPLFFISLLGTSIALLILSINFFGSTHSPFLTVLGLAMYLGFFSFGLGPGAWLIPSEVFATSIRAKAMSLATFLNRVTATIMASTFLSLAHTISWAGFFLALSVVCVLIAVFFYVYLPETKGRSLEDMSLYFAEITGDQSILEAEKRYHQVGTSSIMDGVNTTTSQHNGEASARTATDVHFTGTLT